VTSEISNKALDGWIRQMAEDEFFQAFIGRFEKMSETIQNGINNNRTDAMLYERGMIMAYKNIRNHINIIKNKDIDTEQET